VRYDPQIRTQARLYNAPTSSPSFIILCYAYSIRSQKTSNVLHYATTLGEHFYHIQGFHLLRQQGDELIITLILQSLMTPFRLHGNLAKSRLSQENSNILHYVYQSDVHMMTYGHTCNLHKHSPTPINQTDITVGLYPTS